MIIQEIIVSNNRTNKEKKYIAINEFGLIFQSDVDSRALWIYRKEREAQQERKDDHLRCVAVLMDHSIIDVIWK